MANNEEEQEELTRQEKIDRALREIFGDEGALVNKWVLITESLPEHGKDLDCTSNEDMESWECLGLLRAVQIVVEDQLLSESYGASHMMDDEDDE